MHPYVNSSDVYKSLDIKSHKFSLTDKSIKRMWYTHIHTHTHTHNGILFNHQKNKIMPFAATWMDLEMIVLSKISWKDKSHIILLICGI